MRLGTAIGVTLEPLSGIGSGMPGGGSGRPPPMGLLRSSVDLESPEEEWPSLLLILLVLLMLLPSPCLCRAFRPHRLADTAAFVTAASAVRLGGVSGPAGVPEDELRVDPLRWKIPRAADPAWFLAEALLGSAGDDAAGDGAEGTGDALPLWTPPLEGGLDRRRGCCALGVCSLSLSASVVSCEEIDELLGAWVSGDTFWGELGAEARLCDCDLAESIAMALAAGLSSGGDDDGLKMSACAASVTAMGAAKDAERIGAGIGTP